MTGTVGVRIKSKENTNVYVFRGNRQSPGIGTLVVTNKLYKAENG